MVMKKFLAVLLVLVLAFTFAACSGSGDNGATEAPSGTDGGGSVDYSKVKVGVIHIGDPADGTGYSFAHDEGIKGMQEALNLTDDQIVRKLNVADDNNQLIWETSAYSNKTREYTYSGGNLVQVKEWDSFMPPSSAAVQTFALGSEEPENKEMLPCDEKSGYEVTDTEVIADEQPAEAVNEAPAEEAEESTE